MKILMFTRHSRSGASSRLRSYQYLPYLKENHIDVSVTPLFNDQYLEGRYSGNHIPVFTIVFCYMRRIQALLWCRKYDLLWIEKELFPFLPAWAEQVLSFFRIPYVVDFDDAVFHNYDLHKRKIVRYILGSKIKTIMKSAALVIAGNQYIAEYAKNADANRVEIIPTVIDLNRYHIALRRLQKVFTIGWIGSFSTIKFLQIVVPVINQFCNDVPARVVLVGSGPISLGEIRAEVRSWSETTEVADIQSFDVGIMPLSDEPWEQGKCGYKLIQYMACGIPVIASPVGINKEIVDNGVNGYLASNPEEWMYALKMMYNQPELRVKLGQSGRKNVESRYSLQIIAPLLMRLLKESSRDGV
nr:glycosyltransferase family 4 protein [Bacteroidota bacterium]